jgi:hypothetical protein
MSGVDTTCGDIRVGPCASGLRLRLSYGCQTSRGRVGTAWSYILRRMARPGYRRYALGASLGRPGELERKQTITC